MERMDLVPIKYESDEVQKRYSIEQVSGWVFDLLMERERLGNRWNGYGVPFAEQEPRGSGRGTSAQNSEHQEDACPFRFV
jgi:hypothetical protein